MVRVVTTFYYGPEEHMAHAAMSGEASWYPLVGSDGEDAE